MAIRTINPYGYTAYPPPVTSSPGGVVPWQGMLQSTAVAAAPTASTAAPSSSGGISGTQSFAQEYGGVAKNIFSPTSTSMAEGLNTAYDWATGWNSAAVPGTNLATGTTSSGTFGGGNLANAAYGYAGGKIGEELFDGKEYAGLGGTVGATLGGAAAVGGTAAAAALGAQVGVFAGPIGALAGAVLGAAIGSMFGGDAEDYRFRTYSGELGEDSALNTGQFAEKKEDWYSINTQGKGRYKPGDIEAIAPTTTFNFGNPTIFSGIERIAPESKAYERFVASGDYSKNTSSAYKWLKEGNTFTIGDKFGTDSKDYKKAIDNDYASFDGAFGKYTVGHVDDIPGRTNFAKSWVGAIEKLDAAVASILTPAQIAASKKGLSGSIQGTPDWHNKSGQNYATDGMIFDRYVAIFELSGRDDLAGQLVEGMDRSISGEAKYTAEGGEGGRARIIPLLEQLLKDNYTPPSNAPVVSRSAPVVTNQTPVAQPRAPQPARQPAPQPARRVSVSANTPQNNNNRRRIKISRPKGSLNKAMELKYV